MIPYTMPSKKQNQQDTDNNVANEIILNTAYQQRLLFDGFIRIEILIHLTNDDHKIVPQEVINLCNKFYELDIKTLSQSTNQGLLKLMHKCDKNKESFIAFEIARSLTTSYPKKDLYHASYALILSHWNVLDEAEIEYQKAIELDPDYPQHQHNYGVFFMKLKKYESALLQFENVNTAQSMLQQSICYDKLKDFDNAKKCCIKAMELEPNNTRYRYQYGMFLVKHKMHKEALEQFSKVMKVKPNDAASALKCAQCWKELNNIENAHKCFLAAIEIDGGKNQKYCNYYARFLGQDMGDFDNAKIYFMKAIEIEPMNGMTYYRYAAMLRDYARDYVEAEKYYLKALEMENDYRLHASYGYLLYLMGDYEKAMKYVKEGLKMNDNKWVHVYYGLLNKVQGNDKVAEEELLKAVELVKDKEEAMKCVKIMKEADVLNVDYYQRFETLIDK